MRMLRLALVLLVLASFIAATVAVSMAATVTPTVKPMAKPTMMPIKNPSKMIDLQQMKTNIGNVYKNLMKSTKMPAKPGMPGNKTTSGAGKTMSGMNAQQPIETYSPSLQLNTPAMQSIQTPTIVNQLGAMPTVGGTKAATGSAPGTNLMIGLGI